MAISVRISSSRSTSITQAGVDRCRASLAGVSLFVFQGVDAFKRFCEDEHQRAAADEQAASLFAHYRRELLKENL
ncbi:hypothetical protein KUV41_12550 [Halomonas sp. DP8Y7-1]|uniref:hypothetical protein n=1 Tax=Halomonas sp. DP8Y7-1 TaxID=2859078 RepID=UPI001C93D26A|nr:hypothetical protein [Halomonas sp. DP8Y7-1]MBY6030185.1 hypothetical protein [Halomonas sp. DP8Y7-1]